MKEFIELRGKDIKISYLFTIIFIISFIFALTGFWIGLHRIIGLNDPIIAISALFVLAFILSSLIALFISKWPSSIDIEFSQVEEVKDVKGKEIPKEEKTPKQKESLRPDTEVKKEDTFEVRTAEFLESPAYQYLFDYVKRMIEENDIHIYWEKVNLDDMLVDFNQNETSNEKPADDNLRRWGFNQLRLFLAKNRFYFSEKDFEDLVEKELFRQTYEDFKKYVISRNPRKPDDYILSFLKFVREYEYPNADTREIVQKFTNRELDVAYLEKILKEENIDYDYTNEDLYGKIKRVGGGLIF